MIIREPKSCGLSSLESRAKTKQLQVKSARVSFDFNHFSYYTDVYVYKVDDFDLFSKPLRR